MAKKSKGVKTIGVWVDEETLRNLEALRLKEFRNTMRGTAKSVIQRYFQEHPIDVDEYDRDEDH